MTGNDGPRGQWIIIARLPGSPPMLFRTQIFGPRIGGFGITAVRRIFNGVFRL